MISLRTNCIILRQTPFQESGRILSCISPDYGRLDFIVKGASSLGRRKFPTAGLFRELSVEFNKPVREGTLLSMKNREPVSSFDEIALNTEHYLAACKFAAFLLANTKPMLECPQTYCALKRLFIHLAQRDSLTEPMLSLAYLAYLDESGLIPIPEDPAQIDALEKLIAAAKGGELPQYVPAYWEKVVQWRKALLRHNRINLNSDK